MTATTALYPTIERLADLSRTTVGYQKPDLEREAVECYRECAALRAEREEAHRELDERMGWD